MLHGNVFTGSDAEVCQLMVNEILSLLVLKLLSDSTNKLFFELCNSFLVLIQFFTPLLALGSDLNCLLLIKQDLQLLIFTKHVLYVRQWLRNSVQKTIILLLLFFPIFCDRFFQVVQINGVFNAKLIFSCIAVSRSKCVIQIIKFIVHPLLQRIRPIRTTILRLSSDGLSNCSLVGPSITSLCWLVIWTPGVVSFLLYNTDGEILAESWELKVFVCRNPSRGVSWRRLGLSLSVCRDRILRDYRIAS